MREKLVGRIKEALKLFSIENLIFYVYYISWLTYIIHFCKACIVLPFHLGLIVFILYRI